MRFGIETHLSGMAVMVGLFDALATTNADFSTLVQSGIGVCKDAADSNWKIVYRNGSGTLQTVATSATYPANTSATDYYELRLFCPTKGGDIYYSLHRLNTGNITEGHLTTNLPTTLLKPFVCGSNRAATGTYAVSVSSIFISTDY
jgi:hypothetical protein